MIAVVGGAVVDQATVTTARSVGRRLAEASAMLVCGGRGGVMAAAVAGAKEGGGHTVGILPGQDAAETPPAPGLDVALFTGMGQARNLAVVLSAQAVIAIGGGWGTLSEIALARKHGRPVILLGSWRVEAPTPLEDPGLVVAKDAEDAVRRALDLAHL